MSASLAEFYRGKRVLISGHTGFAGGWLAAWLKLLGAKVSGYGSPPSTRPNLFDATLLDRGMTSIFGDLRNREALASIFAESQPEIVIHYASQVSAHRAQLDPVEAFATNAMGTVHILEEARHMDPLRAVVIANSNRCCEDAKESAFDGDDPYSASAACVEMAASAYSGAFFRGTKTAVATARSGNSIGGGDWTEGEMVPELVRAITSEKQIVIEQGSSVRLWPHVLDPVRAQLLLAQKLFEQGHEFSGPWNFGPRDEDAITVRQLAESFVKQWGAGKLTFSSDQPTSQPAFRSAPKAQIDLGWEPVLSIDETVAWTVEWYKAFYADPALSWRITEEQIQRFMKASGG